MATALLVRISGTTGNGAMPWIGVSHRLATDASGTDGATAAIAANMTEAFPVDSAGNMICWITDYVASPFLLAGQIDFSLNAREDATTTNISVRARVCKVPARIEDGVTLVGKYDYGTELGTSGGDRTWSGTPASPVPFELNSRLLVFFSFYNFGTAAAGTGTISNDVQNGVTLTETVTFNTAPALVPIRSVPVLGQPRPLF